MGNDVSSSFSVYAPTDCSSYAIKNDVISQGGMADSIDTDLHPIQYLLLSQPCLNLLFIHDNPTERLRTRQVKHKVYITAIQSDDSMSNEKVNI